MKTQKKVRQATMMDALEVTSARQNTLFIYKGRIYNWHGESPSTKHLRKMITAFVAELARRSK